MEIKIDDIYVLEDGKKVVCIDKGEKYSFFCEYKEEEDKIVLDYTSIRAYASGEENEGFIISEDRVLIEN